MAGLSAGHRQYVFVAKETTFNTLVEPDTNDAIHALAMNFKLGIDKFDRDDKNNTPNTTALLTEGRRGEGSLETYFAPVGAAFTGANWIDVYEILDALFQAALDGTAQTSAVASAASSTVFDVTAGHGSRFEVGQMIVLSAGNVTFPMARFITVVSTDTLTVAPALPVTPNTSVVVTNGYGYQGKLDPQDSFSVWIFSENHCRMISGWRPGKLMADVAKGDKAMKWNFSGKYADELWTGATTINEGSTWLAADTTLTVADGTRGSVGSLLLIEAEVVKVTAISGNNWTVTRNYTGSVGGAVNHADLLAVVPYRWAATTSGTPAVFSVGQTLLNGSAFANAGSKFEYDLNVMHDEDQHGSAVIVKTKRGKTIANATPRFVVDETNFYIYAAFRNATQKTLFVQIGKTIGYIIAFYVATGEFTDVTDDDVDKNSYQIAEAPMRCLDGGSYDELWVGVG